MCIVCNNPPKQLRKTTIWTVSGDGLVRENDDAWVWACCPEHDGLLCYVNGIRGVDDVFPLGQARTTGPLPGQGGSLLDRLRSHRGVDAGVPVPVGAVRRHRRPRCGGEGEGTMDKIAIISDLHGDAERCLHLLKQIGAIDEKAQRLPGWRLIQVGDLIHGGHHENIDDQLCVEMLLPIFDTVVLGNHEVPHLFPRLPNMEFGGQTPISRETFHMLATEYGCGKLVVATEANGWLVTHAGVHPLIDQLPADNADAAAELSRLFARLLAGEHTDSSYFLWIGRGRGGFDPVGGIFWNDYHAMELVSQPRKQVFGHTPQIPAGYARHESVWCLDAGAKLSKKVSALVSSGDDWEPVVL